MTHPGCFREGKNNGTHTDAVIKLQLETERAPPTGPGKAVVSMATAPPPLFPHPTPLH